MTVTNAVYFANNVKEAMKYHSPQHTWHAQYLAIAARYRLRGWYAHARRYIGRAKGARLVYPGGRIP